VKHRKKRAKEPGPDELLEAVELVVKLAKIDNLHRGVAMAVADNLGTNNDRPDADSVRRWIRVARTRKDAKSRDTVEAWEWLTGKKQPKKKVAFDERRDVPA
jgi:hypothetical protein